MSFFFAKAEKKAKSAPIKRAAPTSKQNAATLHRLGCTACPLNHAKVQTPKMGPTLSPQTEVLFLAEAPGRDEDENTGKPLTGPSGQLVRQCIPKNWSKYSSFDNVCNCRPEGNRTPVWQEIECCRPRRNRVVEEAKPKLIIGLGAVPLSFMLGSADISNLRGRFFAVKVGDHSCWFMPTYHPSYILRLAHNKARPLMSRLGHCFRKDIENAFEALETLPEASVEKEEEIRKGVVTFDGSEPVKILTLLEAARQAPIKAIDIETSCLRPYASDAKILTIAISFGDTNFSFAWDHPQAKWTEYDKKYDIRCVFRDLLNDDTIKVAHNAPFELEWLARHFGRDIINHTAWECTMMQAHFLDERKGGNRDEDNTGANRYLGLDFLIRQHFGTAYKHLFQLDKKNMAASELGETLLYNGVDTKYTLKLYHQQKRLLEQKGLYQAYLEAAPRQPTVALMQQQGIAVDQTEVLSLQEKLGKEIEVAEKEINALDVVQKYKDEHQGQFNPLSGPDTLTIFKEYLKRDEVYIAPSKSGAAKSNIGRYSVDKHVLVRIDHPLAKLIVQLRHSTKMKSTYVDGLERDKGKLIYSDGCLHTSFHTTGTETGRLSSSDPNMQNFPKRNGADVRRTVIAPQGYKIVAIDYRQLEGSTIAMCSRDEYYVKALKENYDTHMVWAKKLAELVPTCTPQVDGKFRSMIKNKLVFPAFFGASNESVCAYLSDGCGMAMSQNKVDELMEEFWETFSGVYAWQKKLMKRYYDTGYVETLSGRRRNYPLSRNEAINHPVQGTAAELVCDAMVRLSHLAATTGRWHLHPVLNIHDDLTFVLPDDKSFEANVETLIKEMLTFDFPWVNVPLGCEVSVGPNWADLQPIGEFRSDEL